MGALGPEGGVEDQEQLIAVLDQPAQLAVHRDLVAPVVVLREGVPEHVGVEADVNTSGDDAGGEVAGMPVCGCRVVRVMEVDLVIEMDIVLLPLGLEKQRR